MLLIAKHSPPSASRAQQQWMLIALHNTALHDRNHWDETTWIAHRQWSFSMKNPHSLYHNATSGSVLPIHQTSHTLCLTTSTSLNHWRSLKKHYQQDNEAKPEVCQQALTSLQKLGSWYTAVTNVSVDYMIIWRSQRFVHYALFFWTTLTEYLSFKI
jgi:hypothetical protein